jgi:putative FmdB family regulatory protein
MPLYEYQCGEHGLFEGLNAIARSSEPVHCPECEQLSPRVLSVPHLGRMTRSEVIARDRNERSRHEPRLSKTPGNCSHAGPCNHGAQARSKPGELKVYTGKRPWVIEHA